MFKKIMAALLATVAFMPAAQAQDREGREPGAGRGDAQRGPEGQRPERRFDQLRSDQPRSDQPRPDQPRPAPQQQRADGWRGGEGRGGDWRGDMAAARAQRQQAQAQAQGQVQPQGQVLVPGQRDGGPGRGNRQWDGQRNDGQRNDGQRGDWRRNDGQGGNWQRGGWQGGDPGRPAPGVVEQRRSDEARNNGFDRNDRDRRRFDNQPRNGGPARWNADRGWSDGRNGNNWNGRNDWSRRWRDDNRYDWGRYRQQNRNLFHLPRYYAPYDWNYGYRRFSIGVTLSSLLWSQDYWIDEPAYYRLPPAYGPYRWVRYYNDALLVDIRTGYVVDTVYDIFW